MADGNDNLRAKTTQKPIAASTMTELERVQAKADEMSASAEHRIGPMETFDSAADRLNIRLDQAHALANMIIGDGYQAFAGLNCSMQQSYLWTIEHLISAARVDAELAVEEAKSR